MSTLGEAAAAAALGLMQWWCSLGLIAVYAKVGCFDEAYSSRISRCRKQIKFGLRDVIHTHGGG